MPKCVYVRNVGIWEIFSTRVHVWRKLVDVSKLPFVEGISKLVDVS
jgi:hypothetical protein